MWANESAIPQSTPSFGRYSLQLLLSRYVYLIDTSPVLLKYPDLLTKTPLFGTIYILCPTFLQNKLVGYIRGIMSPLKITSREKGK